jgi:3-deoxy-manno-octulosonate cytidylyltransferase (CMP-KDO synthetase)
MQSARFADKPLRDINGKSLIQRVYENVIAEFGDEDVYIAHDGELIGQHVRSFGAKEVATDPNLPSGTDRITAALDTIDPTGEKYDIVVNFQGDDVNVQPGISRKLVQLLKDADADVATVVQPIDQAEKINNPAIVKVAMVKSSGRCLYFSRSPIPFDRDANGVPDAFWHIGMYVYRTSAMRKFVSMPVGELEAREKLEQLRFLENGMSIFALIEKDTRIDPRAPADVNTKEDYEEVLKYIK